MNQRHIHELDQYLISKGLLDEDIRMELLDHFIEDLESKNIESELIPSDILSNFDDEFHQAGYLKTYQILTMDKFKRNPFKSIFNLFGWKHIINCFILIITLRIVQFIFLPGVLPQVLPTMNNEYLQMTNMVVYLGFVVYVLHRPLLSAVRQYKATKN